MSRTATVTLSLLVLSGCDLANDSKMPATEDADSGSAPSGHADTSSRDSGTSGDDTSDPGDTTDSGGSSDSGGGDSGTHDSGADDSGTSTSGTVLFHATFDDRDPGIYTEDMVAGDFGLAPSWNNGLDEGHVVVAEEDGHKFLRVSYPTGAVGTRTGGCQFPVPLDGTYGELYVSYRIRFKDGFDFVLGGKLPGLCGGACNTGGTVPTGTDGWSARMMWRTAGDAVQYMYYPDQAGTYGDDFNWDVGGQRTFEPGRWHTVETRIVMNTPGAEDGVVQAWFDGDLALDRRDVRFRDVDSFGIDTMYFSTFFGGSGAEWAPTADETIDFDDLIVSTGPSTH